MKKLLALTVLLLGCSDSPTAPIELGATGTWNGDVAALIADGVAEQGLAITLNLRESDTTIHGLILSSIMEDQALEGVRDGDRLVLTLQHTGAQFHLRQHGDEMSGTASIPYFTGKVAVNRVYRVRLQR